MYIRTDATSGQKPGRTAGWIAVRFSERFQHVNAKGQGYDRLRTRSYYHTFDPQTHERYERSECFHDVGVIGPGFRYHAS